MTFHRVPKLAVAKESVVRLKQNTRGLIRKGRGQQIGAAVNELRQLLKDGTVRTVVWEDGGGNLASYPILQRETRPPFQSVSTSSECSVRTTLTR
jgi:hypothetical protein